MNLKKRVYLIVLIIFLLCVVPFVSGFRFNDFLNGITGMAASDTTAVTISVGNSAPVCNTVGAIATQSVTEAGTTTVTFNFTATDSDGVSNLDDSSAYANFSKASETTRTAACSLSNDIDSTTANYSCSIDMWYWDATGSWTVSTYIKDINDAAAVNDSTSFTYDTLTAMTMTPVSLTWPSVNPGTTDTLSDNDPITINNTGNYDVGSGNVRVKAINLSGTTTPTDIIPANNFSANVNDECGGTVFVEGTATGIGSSIITAGNNSAGEGQEELYFCLEIVPIGISSQTYDTTTNGEWTIDVT